MHSTPFTVPGITTAIDVGKTKLDAHVASPRTSRNFVRSIGKEARNDLTDSGVLAVFSRLQLAETCEPKAETQKQVDHMGTPHHLMDCPGALRMASRGFFKDAANSMHRSIEATMEEVACLDTRIAAQMRSQEGRKRRSEIIRSVPGRGAVTAAVLCAEMPEAGAVGQARAAALLGAAPFDRHGGQSRGTQRIRAVGGICAQCCTWLRGSTSRS